MTKKTPQIYTQEWKNEEETDRRRTLIKQNVCASTQSYLIPQTEQNLTLNETIQEKELSPAQLLFSFCEGKTLVFQSPPLPSLFVNYRAATTLLSFHHEVTITKSPSNVMSSYFNGTAPFFLATNRRLFFLQKFSTSHIPLQVKALLRACLCDPTALQGWQAENHSPCGQHTSACSSTLLLKSKHPACLCQFT